MSTRAVHPAACFSVCDECAPLWSEWRALEGIHPLASRTLARLGRWCRQNCR